MCGHNHPTMIKIHSFFLSPKNQSYQAILILEWITSTLFHLQYQDWGETLEQDTEPPTACPGAAAIWLPTALGVFTAVCVHLDGLNAEHKFRVWVTLSGHTSLHFSFTKFDYVWQCKSFNSRLLSKWGTIQGSEEKMICKKWLFADHLCSSTEERGGLNRAH